MTLAHAAKLRDLARCPSCGEWQQELEISAPARFARVTFTCGAIFSTANGQIIVDTPCPGSSHAAAIVLNDEVGQGQMAVDMGET